MLTKLKTADFSISKEARFLFVTTVEAFPAPEAARVTRKELADLKKEFPDDFKEKAEEQKQEKLENLLGDLSLEFKVSSSKDTFARKFRELLPNKNDFEYQYPRTNDAVTEKDSVEAIASAKTDQVEKNAWHLYWVNGRLVSVERTGDNATSSDAYKVDQNYYQEKFDKRRYEADVKRVRDQYAAVMNALASAGVNPNMANKDDNFQIHEGVVYIDRAKGNPKRFAVKLYEAAEILQPQAKAGKPAPEQYIDLTDATNRNKIAHAHRRINAATDVLKRGVLIDILAGYDMDFRRGTRANIWKDEMGKTDKYTGKGKQNPEMAVWLRKQGDGGLKALAKKYPVQKAPKKKP